MSSSKAALKAAKAALDAHKYDEAAKEVQNLLVDDPKNYHALVRSSPMRQSHWLISLAMCS